MSLSRQGTSASQKKSFFPCEDLPRLAESFSLDNRKGKPRFLFVPLRSCETEGGRKSSRVTKLGLCLLTVHMC